MMMLGGDLNGHVGEGMMDGFEGVHGGNGFENRNEDGEIILELAMAHSLIVMNTCFEKESAKKVTYETGECKTVMDYILVIYLSIYLSIYLFIYLSISRLSSKGSTRTPSTFPYP